MISLTETTKYCGGCETDLSVDEFNRDKRSKDGLQSRCRGCEGDYRDTNRERRNQQKREHYKANQNRINQQSREYRNANRGKINQRKKEHYRENQDRLLDSQREYRGTINGHLRHVFHGMEQRCSDPKCKDYKNYGDRGIQNKFTSSDEFVNYVINVLQADPRGKHIHRIDNDGNYEPGNIEFLIPPEHKQAHRLMLAGVA